MSQWAVVAACGPTDEEIVRVADLLESVFHHEPQTRYAAIIDSGDDDRQLQKRFAHPDTCELVAIRNRKAGWAGGQWGPLCVGILAAYEWIARQTDADFVMKFDSDALVIAPFARQIESAMLAHPNAAIFGSYKVDCNGNARGFNGWAGFTDRLQKLALFQYEPKRFGRRFPVAIWGRPAGMRRHVMDATRSGKYEPGEHVSGGAYAATRTLLDRMLERNYLAERHCWADSAMSEDVMMGIYARACGLDIAGFAAEGETFGVKLVGLPDTPPRLLERGYSVIHSVKNDPLFSEEQIRAFYREHRLTGVVPTLESPAAHPAAAAAAGPAPVGGAPLANEPVADTHAEEDLDELALGF
jgi:hypothetical protein